jgi:hypothetical protein
MGKYEDLAKRVGALVDEKNKAYGNSFDAAGDFLRLLWPEGCPPEQFDDLLAMARIFDKMKRIATDRDAFGESPYQDIAGYGILGLYRVERLKEVKKGQEFLKAMNEKSTMTPQEIISKASEMEAKFASQVTNVSTIHASNCGGVCSCASCVPEKPYFSTDNNENSHYCGEYGDCGICDDCGCTAELRWGTCEKCKSSSFDPGMYPGPKKK